MAELTEASFAEIEARCEAASRDGGAEIGLSALQKILVPTLRKMDYEGLGEEDAIELSEHLRMAVDAIHDRKILLDEVERLRGDLELAEIIVNKVQQLKKNGRLVELPCKVGYTVYEAVRKWDGRDCVRSSFKPCVKASTVSSFHITKMGDLVACLSRACNYAAFGKDFFLTPEEAEAALKEADDAEV